MNFWSMLLLLMWSGGNLHPSNKFSISLADLTVWNLPNWTSRVRVPMLASPAAARSEPGVDEVWCQIENIRSPGCDSQIFPNLTKAMKDIPVISHSNSDCENVFSLVTRTRLSTIPYEDTNAQQPYHNESIHGVTGKCLLQGGILRSGAAESIPSQPHKPGWVHIMRGYVLDPHYL